MAAGHLLVMIAKAFEKGMGFVLAFCQGLTETEHADVINSFSQARAAITTILTLKTQQWTVLPLKLCALFHWDPEVAMQAANECIQQYERCRDDSKHHRVSFEFVSANGLWRSMVESFFCFLTNMYNSCFE